MNKKSGKISFKRGNDFVSFLSDRPVGEYTVVSHGRRVVHRPHGRKSIAVSRFVFRSAFNPEANTSWCTPDKKNKKKEEEKKEKEKKEEKKKTN